MINEQLTITRNQGDFLVSELGNEMVVMNLKTGSYIGLNEVSADIWKQLENPVTTTQLVEALCKIYEVDEQTCRNQTLECLDSMAQHGLVNRQ